MSLTDVEAVIESAKARGPEPLLRFLRRRMPDASEERIEEAAEVAVETIEAVPVFLARAAQEAEARELEEVVGPVLSQLELYFVRPLDVIPEMTQGLAGLLDDTYLVLRMLQGLDRGPEPFLGWDLNEPIQLLRSLMGDEVGRQLDAIALRTLEEASGDLEGAWGESGGGA